MATIRRATFRIYPNLTQSGVMDSWLDLHRDLYNASLQERRDAWDRHRISVSVYDQMRQLTAIKSFCPEFKPLGVHSLQATLRKLDFAFQAFFRRVKAGQNPGYPRFKSKTSFHGWTYPDHDNWKLHQTTPGKNGFLEIRGIGKLRIRGQARDWGEARTLTLTRRNHQWFASITVDCKPLRQPGNEALGLVSSEEALATISSGERLETPQHIEATKRSLSKAQRNLRRAQKPSQRWKKAQARLRTIYQKVNNQNKNFLHQCSSALIKRASLIATENFASVSTKFNSENSKQRCIKSTKPATNSNFNEFLKMLAYKAEEAGTHLHLVEPKVQDPLQVCPRCTERPHQELTLALALRTIALKGGTWEPGPREEALQGLQDARNSV